MGRFTPTIAIGSPKSAPRRELARPHKRDGYWWLVRRVPREFALYDRRNPVVIGIEASHSLRGRDRSEVMADPNAGAFID